MKKEKGFTATEMMIIGGLIAGAVLGFSKMMKNQSSAVKSLYLRIEVQNIHNTIAELMSNEANCVATLRNISSAPPVLTEANPIPAIMQYQEINGTSQSVPFYETGKTYDGVKITSMEVRPFSQGEDQTPAHKLEIKYQVGTKIVGGNSFSRKMEFFFNQNPSSFFPKYNFSCTAGGNAMARPVIVPVEVSIALPGIANPGSLIRSTFLDCAQGKKAVSCGFNDALENNAEDSLACHIDTTKNRCVATIDSDAENADAVTFQCICI